MAPQNRQKLVFLSSNLTFRVLPKLQTEMVLEHHKRSPGGVNCPVLRSAVYEQDYWTSQRAVVTKPDYYYSVSSPSFPPLPFHRAVSKSTDSPSA